MWIQWTEWATAVCSWSWCSRQRRPYRERALVTIEIGAKNGVLDPVCPLSYLPSWSKPLSYRKLPNIAFIPLSVVTAVTALLMPPLSAVTDVTLVSTVMLQRCHCHRCCTVVSLHHRHTDVAAIAVTVLSRPLLSQHSYIQQQQQL